MRLGWTKLFHAGGRADSLAAMTKLTVAFRNIVKVPRSHDNLSLSAYAGTHEDPPVIFYCVHPHIYRKSLLVPRRKSSIWSDTYPREVTAC